MISADTMAAFRSAYTNRCPRCGEGHLLRGLLTPEPVCTGCGEDLSKHMAGDGAPYVLILILGHFMVATVAALETAFAPPAWVHFSVTTVLTVVLALALLPRVKRFLIAFSMMHDAGEDSRAAPEELRAASRDQA